jgi:hypothetical protein
MRLNRSLAVKFKAKLKNGMNYKKNFEAGRKYRTK